MVFGKSYLILYFDTLTCVEPCVSLLAVSNISKFLNNLNEFKNLRNQYLSSYFTEK